MILTSLRLRAPVIEADLLGANVLPNEDFF
jgi:hypothetical protein